MSKLIQHLKQRRNSYRRKSTMRLPPRKSSCAHTRFQSPTECEVYFVMKGRMC